MSIKRRRYSKEQKEEIVKKSLSGKSVLKLRKENNISPELINCWKKQYMAGE
jgi:transposase-like protein